MTNQLHYPGDVTDIDTTTYLGADAHGAFYQPISAEYDAELDRTTVQFKPIPDIKRFAAENGHDDRLDDKLRVMQLFGGRWS